MLVSAYKLDGKEDVVTYQILEYLVLIAVLGSRLSCEPSVLVLRWDEAVMAPVAVIESELLLLSRFLKLPTHPVSQTIE